MAHHPTLSAVLAPCVAVLLAAACTFVEPKAPRLAGERIPVMVQGADLEVDESAANVSVAVAPPVENRDWLQVGAGATHTAYHLALGPAPRRIFRVDTGRGSDSDRRLLAQPVIDGQGRIYVLDAHARIYVLDAGNGNLLWSRDLRPKEEQEGTLGAGLAVDGNRLYVTTGFAQILALDIGDGRVLWRRKLSAPFRAAPTVADGRVFGVSTDNRTHALDAKTGEVLWTHQGTAEQAALLGGAAPAYDNGILVSAYSSGELFGLRAADGREVWSEFLAQRRRTSAISTISDIRAAPVIDRGRVFAASNSGHMVAVDLMTGARLWQQRIGALHSPWVAGDFLYVISTDNVLLCLTRDRGRIIWGRSLRRYRDEEERRDWISWAGPVLAGDRLIVTGSDREVLAVSPYSGNLLGRIRLPDGADIPPIVARGTLYILTREAELIAWR